VAEPRLALVILAVEDLGRATEFYAAVFGWPRTVATPVYVELALPAGMRLGLYDRRGFARNVGHLPAARASTVTATELYCYVDEVERTLAAVVAAGGTLLGAAAPRDWGDVVGYAGDLDGNVLALAAT
jgi:predicted enzyme related to lactoylglutathione lyase